MYQIIGVQRNQQQRVMATPDTARAARTHYTAALPLCTRVIIHDPAGVEIDSVELSRRAALESDHA